MTALQNICMSPNICKFILLMLLQSFFLLKGLNFRFFSFHE